MRLLVKIALAVLVLALLAGAGQFLLPGYVADRIEAGLSGALGEVEMVRAEVRAYPAYLLLGGYVPALSVDMRRVDLGELTVDAILLDGRNVAVDMRRLLAGDGVAVRAAESLQATFVISEEDLNAYFWSKVNQSKFFSVKLVRDRAVLTGRLNFLGNELDVTVSGVFVVQGGTKVAYVPKEVTVANTRVPQLLMDMITKEWAVVLEFDQEAIPMEITGFLVEDGKLLVYGAPPTS